MKVLKARLFDLKLKEQQAKLEQLGGEKKDIAFGSQIRSYVLHPYQMVKDHRTKEQVGDVKRVLDGDLDGFIKAYLMKKACGHAARPAATRKRGAGTASSEAAARPLWIARAAGRARRTSSRPPEHDVSANRLDTAARAAMPIVWSSELGLSPDQDQARLRLRPTDPLPAACRR